MERPSRVGALGFKFKGIAFLILLRSIGVILTIPHNNLPFHLSIADFIYSKIEIIILPPPQNNFGIILCGIMCNAIVNTNIQ
jgi:hypothetical protein